MKRRVEADEPGEYGTPPKLRRFVPAEWAGDELTAAGWFYDARAEWEAAHGGVDTDDSVPLPDEPWNPEWL